MNPKKQHNTSNYIHHESVGNSDDKEILHLTTLNEIASPEQNYPEQITMM